MKDLIVLALGMTIGAFFLIAALNLGLAPTIGVKFNVTNETDVDGVVNVTALPTSYSQFPLYGADSNYGGLGTITWSQFGTAYLNITTDKGVVLATATASPATFNITGAQMKAAFTVNYTSNGTATKQAPNITSVQVEYRLIPSSQQQGWDAGTTILYRVILPIVLIIAFILYFMGS